MLTPIKKSQPPVGFMKFNMILTTDSEYGISTYNKMPWCFRDDINFFNKQTTNAVCIMGSKTAQDLRIPLVDRDCIVITSKEAPPGFIGVRSFEQALKAATDAKREIYVIGGSRLFNEALNHPSLQTIYYTHIAQSFKCDNFVSQILNIPDMIYTVLDSKTVAGIDTVHPTNLVENAKLTFYSICRK